MIRAVKTMVSLVIFTITLYKAVQQLRQTFQPAASRQDRGASGRRRLRQRT